jgi:hypothetical protein
MHKDVVLSSVRSTMLALTREIGLRYAKEGYRGRFDVDYIYDGKKLYVGESNMRMNGGTDTYMITKQLIGPSFFTSRFVLSNFIPLTDKKIYSFSEIKTLLSSLFYSPSTKTGLIISSANALFLHGLSYIIIGKTKAHAHMLLKQLLTIVKNA